MSLQQKTYTDYKHLGDNGDDTTGSIQPISSSEPVGMATLRRPSENLRSRTEIVRSYQDDLLYYRDHQKYVLDLAGAGVLSWAGTAALGGTGIVNNSTQLTIRPFLSVDTNIKGLLEVGTNGVDAVTYTVQVSAYATDGMNAITVEHRNVAAQPAVLCSITAGPIYRILVTLDASNVAHNSAAVTVAVNTQIALTSALTGKLVASDTGAPGAAAATCAETALDTRVHGAGLAGNATADAEAHVLAANALSTFTTTNPLAEGDVVAIRYEYVIEPLGGDPNDPKGGVPGGRAESNVARGNSSVVPCLFIAADFPAWMPGAIPLVKIVQNVAVWLDGTNLGMGTTGRPGTALGAFINGAAFSGIPTLVINGGISTAVTTVQEALVSIDQRLGQHRATTFVLTDGAASTGGVFSAASALDSALTALGGAAGHITLRRGAYTLGTAVPAGTVIEGEGIGLVTVTLTANTAAGLNTKITDLTVGASAFIFSTAGRLGRVGGAGSITLLTGASSDTTSFTGVLVTGQGVRCTNYSGQSLALSGATDFSADTVTLGSMASDASNLTFNSTTNVAIRNLRIAGSAAQSTQALIASFATNVGLLFDAVRVERTSASIGALLNLSSATSRAIVNDGTFTLTRGAQFLTTTSTSLVTFRNCAFTAPAANTDAAGAARFLAGAVSFLDCSVAQQYNSLSTITATNIYAKRTTFDVAWGKVSGSTPGFNAGVNGTLELDDCVFTNANPLQGGYRPIYGQPSGGGDPLISAFGNVRMHHVDFSTSAEVENSGGTSDPDFTFGMFLDVNRTVGTDQAPRVYLEDTGFFTSMPRHVNFDTDTDGSFFRFYDVNSGTASGAGRSRVEIVNFRTAAQPGASVQAGTESLTRFFRAQMTDVIIRDTTDYTWGTGGFTYAVYPQEYLLIAGTLTNLTLDNVKANVTLCPVWVTGSPTVERVYLRDCGFYYSAASPAPNMRLPAGTAETHYINSDFLVRASGQGFFYAFLDYATCTVWQGTRFRVTGAVGAHATSFMLTSGNVGNYQINSCTFEDDNAARTGGELFSHAGTALALGHGNFILSAGTSFTNANLPLTPPVAGPYTTGGLNYLS